MYTKRKTFAWWVSRAACGALIACEMMQGDFELSGPAHQQAEHTMSGISSAVPACGERCAAAAIMAGSVAAVTASRCLGMRCVGSSTAE